MSNKDLITATKDIVIAMLNSNHIEKDENSTRTTSDAVCNAIDTIYQKLAGLNSKSVEVGKNIRTVTVD